MEGEAERENVISNQNLNIRCSRNIFMVTESKKLMRGTFKNTASGLMSTTIIISVCNPALWIVY